MSSKDKHGSFFFCSSVSPVEEPSDTEKCNIDTSFSGYTSKGGFPGGSSGENLPASAGDAGDLGSIPGLGRSPGGGHDSPLQCSCLENPTHRGRSLAAYSP